MFKLYAAITILLLVAIIILAASRSRLGFILSTAFIIFFACSIYFYTGNLSALKNWQTAGKEHYDLQVQYNDLGGIDGIIEKVKKKVEANPKDADGWIILGKLYVSKGDAENADKAFAKAKALGH